MAQPSLASRPWWWRGAAAFAVIGVVVMVMTTGDALEIDEPRDAETIDPATFMSTPTHPEAPDTTPPTSTVPTARPVSTTVANAGDR